MRTGLACVAVVSWAVAAGAAEAPDLAFRPDGNGFFRFDTGVVRGRLRADGRSQGIASLVDVAGGAELTHGGGGPGLLSYYRFFSTDTRYGDAARDWPSEPRLLPDGAVEVRFPPADDHPLVLTAVYRWTAADTLDLETTVEPKRPMPKFEVFLSSYFAPSMRALVYVKPNLFEGGRPRLLPADVNPLVDGTYLMFPRDRQAVPIIFDRRWEIPPHPVQWSVTRHLAGPLAMRRDEKTGLAVALMAPPADCFAVSMPYNKTPPDGVAGHVSLYLSLFGRDLEADRPARAHTRLVVGRLSDEQALARYAAYLMERQP